MTADIRSYFPRPRNSGRRDGTRRFLADRKGATAVEFAMLIVPFIGLIAAILETGSIYFRLAHLQTVTETASRSVFTYSTASGMSYKQFIEQNICTWQATGVVKPGTLSKMFDCSQILLDVQAPRYWSQARTNNSFSAHDPASIIRMPAPGQIAIVRVVYPMAPIFKILGGSAVGGFSGIDAGLQSGSDGTMQNFLMGIAAFRVEPSS